MTTKSHETHVSLNGKLTKLFLVSIIAILFILANPYSSHAANIGVTVDGVPVSFNSSTGYPFLDKANRTLVPLRAAMEACGCTVDWDESNGIATITKDSNVVKIVIGQNCIYRNNKMIENDSAAVVINGRTYLPIRAVLESFYFSVGWDESSNSVTVTQYNKNDSTNDSVDTNNLSIDMTRYKEFLTHFEISQFGDSEAIYPFTRIMLKFKDSGDKNDLIQFLKKMDYKTLQLYTLQVAKEYGTDYDKINITYLVNEMTYEGVVFNAISIQGENITLDSPISWGDELIK